MAKEKDSSAKIVIVDDSSIVRRMISKVLTDNGFHVVGEAGSGSEGMSLLANSGATLFIIDCVMPSNSGIELAKSLSSLKQNIGIIMISELYSEKMILDSISGGAMDYLRKPFSPSTLVKSVQQIENRLIALED